MGDGNITVLALCLTQKNEEHRPEAHRPCVILINSVALLLCYGDFAFHHLQRGFV